VAFNPDDITKKVVKCADASIVTMPGGAVGILIDGEVVQITANTSSQFYAEVLLEAFKNIPKPPKVAK